MHCSIDMLHYAMVQQRRGGWQFLSQAKILHRGKLRVLKLITRAKPPFCCSYSGNYLLVIIFWMSPSCAIPAKLFPEQRVRAKHVGG